MHLLTLCLGAVALAAWLYLVFARGGFWRFRNNDGLGEIARARIVAVVPARDEARYIGACVASLLGQQEVDLAQVIVVDDGSTDATADRAREAAGAAGRSGLLTVIPGAPLPPGWTGKVWAMRQGAAAAQAHRPDFILFTDADVVHGNLVAALAGKAAQGFDLVSCMVRLQCRTLAEKLLIPAFVYFFFQLYPPRWIADPRRATAGAAGGCVLIRPQALAQAGGLEAIRGEIIDDCALARAVKRAGGRVWLGATDRAASIRPYRSFGAVGKMIARTAFNQLRHSALLLIATLAGMLLLYLAPLALLFTREPLVVALAATSAVLMLVSYLPTLRAYRLNPLWALTLPLAALFYTGATLYSALRYWAGAGGEWKGRAQDRRVAAS